MQIRVTPNRSRGGRCTEILSLEVGEIQYRAGGIQGDLLVGTSLIAAVVLWWTCWRGPWPAVLLSRASVGRSRVAG